ncbi:MAG: BadF/BadG/BcrA/BcrD ATPase family protein [Planctomycetota bacterium]
MDRLVLGIDGGGSKTVARLALVRNGSGPLCVLGSGFAGGSNPYSVGWQAAISAITQAASAARANAGVGELPQLAVLSIAGCASESAREHVERDVAAAVIADRVAVAPDTAPLLASARDGVPAVGVIAGTGSIALGQTALGAHSQVGGWGYLIDDAGSGFSIGQATLRLLCRDEDAGHAGVSALRQATLDTLGVETLAEIKPLVYEHPDPRSKIASLSRTTLRLADDGDPTAVAIRAEQAERLAELAVACASRVGALGQIADCFFAGGVLLGSAGYRQSLVEALRRRWPSVQPQLAPDAACGCCQIAARDLADTTPPIHRQIPAASP